MASIALNKYVKTDGDKPEFDFQKLFDVTQVCDSTLFILNITNGSLQLLAYTGGIPHQLDTDEHSAVQRKQAQRCDSNDSAEIHDVHISVTAMTTNSTVTATVSSHYFHSDVHIAHTNVNISVTALSVVTAVTLHRRNPTAVVLR